jgi:putative hydrolase of the HAD superfamily
MKHYEHIFWDLDHTLWDFDANSRATLAVLYQHFQMTQYGITDFDLFAALYEKHNEALWTLLRKGEISRTLLRWKRMDLTLQEFQIQNEVLALQMSELYLDILPKQGKLMDGALDILSYCYDKGYNMHIITNGFEKTQWEKLNTSNIAHYFQHMFTSESANAMKPNKEIFDYALQQTKAQNQQAIMIGDCLDADIGGALNAGIDQIFYNPFQKKYNVPLTYEISHLMNIKNIL